MDRERKNNGPHLLESRFPGIAYRVAFDALKAVRRCRNGLAYSAEEGAVLFKAETILALKCGAFGKAGIQMAPEGTKEPPGAD